MDARWDRCTFARVIPAHRILSGGQPLGVSGIISVVIAGLSQAQRLKRVNLFDAEVDRVGQIIWNTINFLLNGFVFLGYELISELSSQPSSNLSQQSAIIGVGPLYLQPFSFSSCFSMVVLYQLIVFGRRGERAGFLGRTAWS